MKNYIIQFILFSTLFLGISVRAQEYMDKKKGDYTEKYPNGNIKCTGTIKDHYKTGIWKNYSSNGNLKSVYTYENGKYNGRYIIHFDNGMKEEEGYYSNGLRSGESKTWYLNGKLRYVNHYNAKGEKAGVQQFWNKNGFMEQSDFYGENGYKYISTYHPTGELSSRRTNLNDKKEGPQYFYSRTKSKNPLDTLPYKIETYHNGQMEGPAKFYAGNHVLMKESYFKNGKLDSVAREWNFDGSLKYEFHYKNDLLDGYCINYENGKKMAEGNYKEGKLTGMHTQYQPELCYTWYTDDDMDSCRCYYDTKIMRLHYIMLDPSEKMQKGIEYDSLGKKYKDWILKSNLQNGPEHYYYPNGKIKSAFNFHDGIPTGELKAWNQKGKLVLSAPLDTFGNSENVSAWSDTGEKLKKESAAFNQQVKKYLPDELYFDETEGTILNEFEEAPPMMDAPIEEAFVEEIEEKETDVLMFAEEMPSFPDFQKYLSENLKYPEIEKENGKTGTVYVRFIVEKDGSVSNVEIAKGVGGAPGFDKEAIRVISSMPKWTPGKMNGRVVRVSMIQPIRFVL